jgi:hypothetical protein
MGLLALGRFAAVMRVRDAKNDLNRQSTSGFKSVHRKVRLCELFEICGRLQGVTRQAIGEAEVGQEDCQPH